MQTRTDERIQKILKTVHELPSLARAVELVSKLSQEAEATPKDYAKLIEKDQGLSGRVLRIVNSAFYQLRKAVGSPWQACNILGVNTLKSLVLSVNSANLLRRTPSEIDPIAFWRHSLAAAVAAQNIARLAELRDVDDLYAAGLFHDMGVMLFAKQTGEDYGQVLGIAASRGAPLSQVEQEFFGMSHAEVGWALASRWRLPGTICEAIRWHESDPSGWAQLDPECKKAVAVVQLADQLAAHAGFDFMGTRAHSGPAPSPNPILALDQSAVEGIADALPADLREREQALHDTAAQSPSAETPVAVQGKEENLGVDLAVR